MPVTNNSWPLKKPNEVLDYLYDFLPQLQPGETILDASATVTTGTVTTERVSAAGSLVSFWARGGTPKGISKIDVSITTSKGRTLTEETVMPIV